MPDSCSRSSAVIKIEPAKVTRQMRSSPSRETGPLFPPLHVKEMAAKSGIRAPPRNKMALFEQFTIPFNRKMPSREAALMNPSLKQVTNDRHFDHLSCASRATLVSKDTINCEVGTNLKSSYGSSISSLSTCTAIVNVDESRRVQTQEPADYIFHSCKVTHEQVQIADKKVAKDTSRDVNEAHAVNHSPPRGQPVGLALENLHNCEESIICGTTDGNNVNITKHLKQEGIYSCEEGFVSAGSQLFGPENGESENNMNTDAPMNAQTEGSIHLKSNRHFTERHPSFRCTADPHQRPVVVSNDDSPCIAGVVRVKTPIANPSPCEKMKSAMLVPFSASIKPKDLINVVGQQLFWKARKAIVRQQEIFSNQVFELHKLIKVQKLLAKMSGPLIDEYMLLGGVPDKLGCDHAPTESGFNEQENLGDRRARAPAPSQKCRSQARRPKPQRNFVRWEESEDQVRAGAVPVASIAQVLTNASFDQPCHSLSTDGMSAWGYPMGPLNRPVIYPSGSGSLQSGSSFNGAYVVGPTPPMAPFAFPCYGQRPEPTGALCPNSQWPSAMYYSPFLAPVVHDWFAMNYQGQASLASGSDKAGPTSSVPSINMNADASTHSIQPAVFPCVQQQLGSSRLLATRSLGSHATASVRTPPNAILKRPGAGKVHEQSRGPSPGSGSGCVASEGGGAYAGEKVVSDAEALGWSRNVEGGQLPMVNGRRADRMNADSSLGCNALNLFPLQPSSSSGGLSERENSRQADCQGRVIKAVPRSALAASESAAGILLSIQRERQL